MAKSKKGASVAQIAQPVPAVENTPAKESNEVLNKAPKVERTNADIQAELDGKGIKYPKKANKAALLALLPKEKKEKPVAKVGKLYPGEY